MKRLLGIVIVLVLLLPQYGCRKASAESPPSVSLAAIVAQTGDSIGFISRWQAPAPAGPQQFPLAGFNVRIVEDVVGDTLAGSSVPATVLIDTLWVPMPPLGDTLVVYAAVNSYDTEGNESATWTLSNPFEWITPALLPNPPGPVTIDTTINALVLDSMRLVTHADALIHPETGAYWLQSIGDTLRFGAVLYSGELAVACCCPALDDPMGTHPCDAVPLYDIRSIVPERSSAVRYVINALTFAQPDVTSPHVPRVREEGYMMLPEYLWRQRAAVGM